MKRKYFVEGRWFDDAEQAYSFASVLAFKYCCDIEVKERANRQNGERKTETKLLSGHVELQRYATAVSPTDIGNLAETVASWGHSKIDKIDGELVRLEDALLELHGIE